MFKRISQLLEEDYNHKGEDNDLHGKFNRLKRRGKLQTGDSTFNKRKISNKYQFKNLEISKGTSRIVDGPKPTYIGGSEDDSRFQLPDGLVHQKQVDPTRIVPFRSGKNRFSALAGKVIPQET